MVSHSSLLSTITVAHHSFYSVLDSTCFADPSTLPPYNSTFPVPSYCFRTFSREFFANFSLPSDFIFELSVNLCFQFLRTIQFSVASYRIADISWTRITVTTCNKICIVVISLLYGITDGLLRRLQSVQNAAARLVTGAGRRDHIIPVLRRLHWLPVRQRVVFNVAGLVHQSLEGVAPAYVIDDCRLYCLTPADAHSGRVLATSDR